MAHFLDPSWVITYRKTERVNGKPVTRTFQCRLIDKTEEDVVVKFWAFVINRFMSGNLLGIKIIGIEEQ